LILKRNLLNISSIGLLPKALFVSGAGFAAHFAIMFQPIQGEFNIIGKHPEADHTIRSVPKFEAAMEEMKDLIAPELELIDSRIGGPVKEFQSVLRLIRKSITKREHKVCFLDSLSIYLTQHVFS
jgi:amphiphysin